MLTYYDLVKILNIPYGCSKEGEFIINVKNCSARQLWFGTLLNY